MRKRIVIVWLIVLFAAISGLFWRNEWVYSLPTPIPKNYKPIIEVRSEGQGKGTLATVKFKI